MALRPSAVAGPLSGVVVIDLTRVLAGPFCTMILADLGARVIKVETPGAGDDSRGFPPTVGGRSAYFMSLNRGKESIALDLRAAGDSHLFEALLGAGDVLVENFRPGVLERLGFGWGRLRTDFPRLIYLAASGFGHSGPYAERPAYDMVVQGMGGIMSVTGQPDGPPTRVGTSIGDLTAGLYAAVAIGAALHHRNATGGGMMIDVAMLDCQVAILENAIARYCATGEVPQPLGARHPSIAPFAPFATADGHVIIACGNQALFERLAVTLDRPQLATDARYADNAARSRHAAELARDIEAITRTRPTPHWLAALHAAGIPCSPINNVAQVLADPQVAARNMVVGIDDPGLGWLKVAGNPIKMSAFADPARRGPAPALDEQRALIIAELRETGALE
ncbi:MAG: CoA transferase [Alphaproteobacteria bacterium]|nr:CoA transferase [Alphaproteobacteria bacterium]